MKQRFSLASGALTFMFITQAASTGSAASNPFSDIPADHWAMQAVTKLANDGVITGYGDNTFKGDAKITRFEMAQMVAKAMANQAKAAPDDKAAIEKLQAEFSDELNSLGVRVANMERMQDNVKWSGSYAQKYMEQLNNGEKGSVRGKAYWEKCLDLNVQAKVPGSGFTVNATLNSKMGGNSFNSEEISTEDWNGGHSRRNENRLDKIYVEGSLGQFGQYIKAGLFQPWVQNGAITDATMKGVMLDHYGNGWSTHILAGNLDIKDWDSSVAGGIDDKSSTLISEGWTNDGWGPYIKKYACKSTGYNVWGDFVRKTSGTIIKTETTQLKDNTQWQGDWDHTKTDFSNTNGSAYGSDNDYDPATGKFLNTKKTLYAFIYERKLNKKLSTSLGYYRYKTAAYNRDALQIGALTLDWKLLRRLNFQLNYAHGDKGGHETLFSGEFQYKVSPKLSTYLAYRHLGPDAIVKTNYGDGIGAGQRGVEIGANYLLAKNIQFTAKYGRGHSLTYDNTKRSKIYTCLNFGF